MSYSHDAQGNILVYSIYNKDCEEQKIQKKHYNRDWNFFSRGLPYICTHQLYTEIRMNYVYSCLCRWQCEYLSELLLSLSWFKLTISFLTNHETFISQQKYNSYYAQQFIFYWMGWNNIFELIISIFLYLKSKINKTMEQNLTRDYYNGFSYREINDRIFIQKFQSDSCTHSVKLTLCISIFLS